jgi:NAD(P)-dependent dehydrogenase (short-subunit alcohol dehydrogenase family)
MVNSLQQVLVVGASTSIGNAVLSRFAARGARLLATGRSVEQVSCAGADLTLASLDLLDTASLDRFANITVPCFGKLDVIVFLTGVLPGKSLADYEDDLIQEVMSVNFSSQAALLRRLLPHLNSNSQLIMVSSISAERGSFDPIYAASKAAQIAFVKSLATWMAPNVRVNAIAPGLIQNSGMFLAMKAERQKHHILHTPTQRLTTGEEIAGVITSICEPEWSNLNGQVIRINGGSHV